jgi:excisionase family DNA binding protein
MPVKKSVRSLPTPAKVDLSKSNTPLPKILYDFKGAADLLSSTVWTVRRLHWSGALRFSKVGRRFLVHIDDLQAYAAQFKASAS